MVWCVVPLARCACGSRLPGEEEGRRKLVPLREGEKGEKEEEEEFDPRLPYLASKPLLEGSGEDSVEEEVLLPPPLPS